MKYHAQRDLKNKKKEENSRCKTTKKSGRELLEMIVTLKKKNERLHSLWGMLFDVEKADRARVPVTFKTASPKGDEKKIYKKNAIERNRERKKNLPPPTTE